MAVVTTKSTAITNMDASPIVEVTKGEQGPFRMKSVDARVSSVNGDSIASKYLFFRVPSVIIPKQLLVATAALGGTAAADFGLYYADDTRWIAGGSLNSGVVIDADYFKAAQTLVSALGLTDLTMGNILATVSKFFQPLWQSAGLSADPGGYFDIVATLTAASSGSGDVYARLLYVE